MMTYKNKPLARMMWPALLLSAALSLPAESFAAPSPDGGQKAEKAEKHQNKGQHKAHKNNGRGEERREVGKQRSAERSGARQREVGQQRAAERSAKIQRQAELSRQAERQRAIALQNQRLQNQRLQNQRQAELNRQTELRRIAERQRAIDLQNQRLQNQRNGRYAEPTYRDGRAYDNRAYANRGQRRYGRGYANRDWQRDGGTLVVDGHLTNEGYECQAVRDDNGHLYMLIGNTYGLRTGDHVRLTGWVVDGGYCNWEGTAFEVEDVKALWGDRRHQTTLYHHQHDGASFGDRDRWAGRHPRAFQNRIERDYYNGGR